MGQPRNGTFPKWVGCSRRFRDTKLGMANQEEHAPDLNGRQGPHSLVGGSLGH